MHPPDIIVSILSRDRPEMLRKTMDLLLEAAYNPSNIVFHLIIDDDQVDMYQPLKQAFPDIQVGVCKRTPGTLRQCYIKQLELFIESNSYFLLSATDDLIGVIHHWDRYIANKKHWFEDDIFCLFSGCKEQGRLPQVLERCYCVEPDSHFFDYVLQAAEDIEYLDPKNPLDRDFMVLYRFTELLPILTKKFAQHTLDAFLHTNHVMGIDIVLGSIVQQLYRRHGINRHVLGLPDHFRHINQLVSDERIKNTPAKQGRLDMKLSEKIADQIAERIKTNISRTLWERPDLKREEFVALS